MLASALVLANYWADYYESDSQTWEVRRWAPKPDLGGETGANLRQNLWKDSRKR